MGANGADGGGPPRETPVTRFLDDQRIPYRRIEHPTPALTARDVAEQAGIHPGQVVKAMALGGKEGSYVLALVPGDRRLDIQTVRRRTGHRLSLMRPEKIPEVTGYRVGAVAPFGLKSPPLCIVAEEALFRWTELNISSGHPLLSCQLAAEGLKPFVDGGIFALSRPEPQSS
ncbi:MAG: YbaK/EbsC family protein [Desulfacinum sp.]|nr:YbaK/EbsC family protein [Desulfacinum sp.]